MTKTTKVSIALAGIPGGADGLEVVIGEESAPVAALDTIVSTSSFEDGVALDLSLGPSPSADTVNIVLNVGGGSVSFMFTF